MMMQTMMRAIMLVQAMMRLTMLVQVMMRATTLVQLMMQTTSDGGVHDITTLNWNATMLICLMMVNMPNLW
jgi:hypothetical protein